MPEDEPQQPEDRVNFRALTKVQVSAAFAVEPRTITKWQNEGMPYTAGAAGRGDANLYCLPDCIRWYVRRETKQGLDPEAEKGRLLKEQADAAKRRNQIESGKVVPLETAKLVVQRAASAIRQKIVTHTELTHAGKQALLTDIQTLKGISFENIDPADGDEGETTE